MAGKASWAQPKLRGKAFAVSGRLQHKKTITQWIAKEGGKLLPSLTTAVDCLIVGQKTQRGSTAQQQMAAKLNARGPNIQVIDEAGFFQLLAPTRAEAIAMLHAGARGRKRWDHFHPEGNTPLCELIPVPELSGADLSGADLRKLSFWLVKLDGADLHGCDLRQSIGLHLRGANLDAATLCFSRIRGLVGCRLRQANLRGALCHYGISLEGSDFTGATLEKLQCFNGGGVDVIFKNARMAGVALEGCRFPQADFTGADLTRAALTVCDLSGAKLTGATLNAAQVNRATLINADLAETDLRGANLAGADLTGANLTGTDFSGAHVFGIKLGRADPTKVKGLGAALQPAVGKIGPNIQRFVAIAKQSAWVRTQAKVARPKRLPVEMTIESTDRGVMLNGSSTEGRKYADRAYNHYCISTNVADFFLELAAHWGAGKFLPASVTVDIRKGPVRQKELLQVATAAWQEAFPQ
jgi:uncharacterized protein YjbI with pentapeptide repeats